MNLCSNQNRSIQLSPPNPTAFRAAIQGWPLGALRHKELLTYDVEEANIYFSGKGTVVRTCSSTSIALAKLIQYFINRQRVTLQVIHARRLMLRVEFKSAIEEIEIKATIYILRYKKLYHIIFNRHNINPILDVEWEFFLDQFRSFQPVLHDTCAKDTISTCPKRIEIFGMHKDDVWYVLYCVQFIFE